MGMSNGMGMMNGHSNTPALGMQNQPAMNTFNINPMSLGPMPNSNGGSMARSSSGNGGNNGGGGGGSMHTPNQGLINSPTRNSYTSPSYGQQNSQSPYGHHPPQGSSSGAYPPHAPMGILRPVRNQPQSPLNLSGIRGVG